VVEIAERPELHRQLREIAARASARSSGSVSKTTGLLQLRLQMRSSQAGLSTGSHHRHCSLVKAGRVRLSPGPAHLELGQLTAAEADRDGAGAQLVSVRTDRLPVRTPG